MRAIAERRLSSVLLAGDRVLLAPADVVRWFGAVQSQDFGPAKWSLGELAGLLGPGSGLCLDLGCGTGQYADAIRGTGLTIDRVIEPGEQPIPVALAIRARSLPRG